MVSMSPNDLVAWFNSANKWSWEATAGTVAATIIGSIIYLFNSNQKRQRKTIEAIKGIDRDNHATEVGVGTGVYKCAMLKEQKEKYLDTFYPDVTTLYTTFQMGMKSSRTGKCLGTRVDRSSGPYKFLSYSKVFKKSKDLGSNLITKLGITPGNNTKIGIYAKNCQEWLITTLASIRYSMVIVPLYDTLGPDAATFIIEHAEIQLIVVEDLEKAKRLLANSAKTPLLKHIIIIEKVSKADIPMENLNGIQIHLFDELLDIDESQLVVDIPPRPEDIYIICGTTGDPKGVILTHRNLVANISAFAYMIDKFIPELFFSTQVVLSYLPLSHVMEQVSHWTTLLLGGAIGYYSGDVSNLSADLQELKPTIFPVVPRLLNRFNDTIKSHLRKTSKFGQWAFNFAYQQKLANLKNGYVTSFWDKIVFKNAQKQLGGNIKLIITGSAPIAPEVLESCRIVFGAHILEGYGQTESTAMATCTWPGEYEGGHCGGPSVCVNLKLNDVPDLNYYSKDRKGEVMLKGPSITSGYYKDPEKTAELFDSEGFLHTGDIGYLLPNGKLKIIDRKKHIFKLAQGEYVAPEKIENVYIQSQYVQQVYVDGDSLERFLLAVVVPMERAITRLYQELYPTDSNKSLEEICKDKKVNERILKDLQQLGKSMKLNSLEQVKAIHIDSELFSVENGLLTPTLKSKRPQLRQKYKEIFKDMYKNIYL